MKELRERGRFLLLFTDICLMEVTKIGVSTSLLLKIHGEDCASSGEDRTSLGFSS